MMARTINPEVRKVIEEACIVKCKTSSIKDTGKNISNILFPKLKTYEEVQLL